LALVLLVVAAAATGIRSAGIVAALSSALWFDFLTQPYPRFTITDQARRRDRRSAGTGRPRRDRSGFVGTPATGAG
jgi:hypothetical protein